ncbi:hypothetical protein SERLADRAFT_432398 [Serpula lacrymans var. lacrymans S7.9]|uniref:Uncharacterized protein n=1 Tax=Serpula lacrymans var. lacrymans (strain S7.9) TaxID=578457 RepID=F8NF15_SERL9|nr:uncharacterized protein SERLADRAFT_432398 [Serpula lacrymans var. lacrymans S7.9]EGO30774.1 hypothetical protein SERLADRAFT_432398 [Serpula lacrymans var. lacrymans S7.9]
MAFASNTMVPGFCVCLDVVSNNTEIPTRTMGLIYHVIDHGVPQLAVHLKA